MFTLQMTAKSLPLSGCGKRTQCSFVERKRPMTPLFFALLLWLHFAPQKALKRTVKISFKSYGSSACDLKPNQGDISARCNCNIMRVDKTLLFNTMIFTCHLSLSLRSVNRIDSISSTAQNKTGEKKSPIQWQTLFTLTVVNISQSQNAQTHIHTHTITKQGFGDWGFEGVYVHRFGLWIWVWILFEEKTDVCSATKTVNSSGSAFGKPPTAIQTD